MEETAATKTAQALEGINQIQAMEAILEEVMEKVEIMVADPNTVGGR